MSRRTARLSSREWRPETERDQRESAFAPPLREVYLAHPSVLACVLVDPFGECVDYCTALDVFDAKIAAAQLQVTMGEVRCFGERVAVGRSAITEIVGERRSFLLREVGQDYGLVVVVEGALIPAVVLTATERCVLAVRDEAGLSTPSWDPKGAFEVETRRATGWDFAPATYMENDERHEVADVIGRWEEGGGLAGSPLVCFRVRNVDGSEITIAFDPGQRIWLRW